MGVNGAGKSTLIKLLSGVEAPTTGTVELGHKVDVEYFAQDQYKEMDPDTIMFEEIGRMAPRMGDAQIRTLLGCFLFTGDDVFKRVGVLSGGERNRFALARMLLQPRNFLLLDEPTNHLDMRAKDVLLRAMLDFTGTIVFVSHDRYFIDRLSTKVYAIGGGGMDTYPGNYEDYLWSLERRNEAAAADKAPGGPSADLVAALAQAKGQTSNGQAGQNGHVAPNGPGEAAQRKRMNPLQANKLRDRVRDLETEVARLEDESKKLQAELATAGSDYDRQTELLAQMERRRKRIEANEAEWEELTEKLEAEA